MEEARRVKGKEKMKEEDDRQETQTKERREPNDSDGTDHSFSHDTQLNWTAVLLGLGLKKDASMYHRLFQEHRIDSLAVLAALSKEDLKNCGIRLGHLPVFADLIDHYEQKKAEALRKSYMSPSSGDNSSLVEERAISILSRLKGVIRQVVHGLIDREVQVELMVLALLCKEHVLLLGPPGVAKSNMCQRMAHLMGGEAGSKDKAFFFSRLLTRFTLPDELFGPISLHKLKDDKHERVTAHYLPEARVAYLDEIFKAGSAILNSLLTILNEREFDNGRARVKVPLQCMVGASNEYPSESGELQALYDRFLFRIWLDASLSRTAFHQLLNAGPETDSVNMTYHLDGEVIDWVHDQASKIPFSTDITDFLLEISEILNQKGGYHISPRRWRKIGGILRVAAFCNNPDPHGNVNVSLLDCALLQHLVWHRHHQKPFVWETYLKVFEERLQAMPSAKICTMLPVLQHGIIFGIDRPQRAELAKIVATVVRTSEEHERRVREQEEKKRLEEEQKRLAEEEEAVQEAESQKLIDAWLANMPPEERALNLGEGN